MSQTHYATGIRCLTLRIVVTDVHQTYRVILGTEKRRWGEGGEREREGREMFLKS